MRSTRSPTSSTGRLVDTVERIMKLFRGQPDNWKWKPSQRESARIWLGLALVFYVLAAVSYSSTEPSNTTGRWGWLVRMAIDVFGPQGESILYSLEGTAFLIIGIGLYWRAGRVK